MEDNRSTVESEQQNIEWIWNAKNQIIEKMTWVSEKSKEKIPYTTIDGVHDNRLDPNTAWTLDNGVNWWTNGFFAGMMWQMYTATKDRRYVDIARFSEEKLDQCFADYYGLNHDVGFMWLLTAVADYKITGNPESKKRGMHAANILAGRYNIAGHFIRAWNEFNDGRNTKGWAIIDCLMNLPLLYFAEQETMDFRYEQIAENHADMAEKYFLREDGSVNHIVEFDPQTGEYICSHGGQGYAKGSSWTRGQAWAIYGFALSYKHTHHDNYLAASKKAANYFIQSIPVNGFIPVDFKQPETPAYEDSTAAVIAASGLLELAEQVEESEQKRYKDAAIRILKQIYEQRCDFTQENDCILQKCTASYDEKEHEYNIIYGDYYFIEAVFKLCGCAADLW